jgi:pentatricopeptide repeat protein
VLLQADGVVTTWAKAVNQLKITPDEGCCISVLHTAARHGLSSLAPEVIRVLSTMNVSWAEHHFAPVVEAFCRDADVKEAFAILELMRNNDVTPTLETAQPIFEVISANVDAVDEAYGMLVNMHQEGRVVDISAFNVIIQACVALVDLQRALGMYQSAKELGVVPDVETYNLLLSACISARHRELGDRLLKEMMDAGITPDVRTYERLVVLCLTQATYEDAFYYLEEMKTRGLIPTQAIYEAIIRKCFTMGDTRHQLAIEEMLECGYVMNGKLQKFLESNGSSGTKPFNPKPKVFAPKDEAADSTPV